MYHLIRVTGIVIALTLLLAVFVRPAQASNTIHAPTDNGDQAEDTVLICLALVGGTAILAAGMWMEKLRRMLS
jgi:succinate dehydrogenase hydrophobic anchor subunit